MEAPPARRASCMDLVTAHSVVRNGQLIPPSIDFDAFRSTIELVAISVIKARTDAVKKNLNKMMLEMEHMKPIVDDPDPQRKRLLLKRDVSLMAIENPELQPEVVRQILISEASAKLARHVLQITVDNIGYDEILKALLPDDIEIPTSFEIIGHIAHLNLRPPQIPYQHLIGQAILKKVSALRTVINKTSNIESEFRTLPLQVIAGDNDLETAVRESGCTLKMNFAEVYWNSRLQAEHTRLVDSFAVGDKICDMTAGIGPFAIPAAKKGCQVWANDLNPASHKYLVINGKVNKIAHCLHAYNLDARAFARELANQQPPLTFTRYIINLPAMSIEFLDVFVGLYPAGTFTQASLPLVHCYCFTSAADPRLDVIARASERIGFDLRDEPFVNVLEVRDVAPKKLFMCLSFRVPLTVIERAPGVPPSVVAAAAPTTKRKSDSEEAAPAAAAGDAKKPKGGEQEKEKEKESGV